MAEKRYRTFVVTGDDEAKTTRHFYYIGSGKNRSFQAMRENALDYYEERFPQTWFPDISEEKNYSNKDPHEFNNLVQIALAENRAEHTRIPNFGDRWVVTPKVEETPGNDQEETTIINVPVKTVEAEWYTPPQNAQVTGQMLGDDDRVGLPDDEDDYEEEEIRADGEASREPIIEDQDYPTPTQYDPALIDGVAGETFVDVHDTDELPALQVIGGYPVNGEEKDADKKRDQQPKQNGDKIPTQEEMDEEIARLRENPESDRKGDSGQLRADRPFSPCSGNQTTVAL